MDSGPPFPPRSVERRSHTFLARTRHAARWIEDPTGAPAEVPPRRDPHHLSIAEVFLPLSRGEWSACDFLFVFDRDRAGEDRTDAGSPGLGLVGPGTLRGHAAVVPAGLVISEIPTAAVPDPLDEVHVGLFRFPRTPSIGQVVDSLERLNAALRHATDPRNARALAESILDRLELLDRTPGVVRVVDGVHRIPSVARTPRHFALLTSDPGSANTEVPFLVRDGHLCRGLSSESASPWRGGPFVLLRIGPRRAGIDPDRIQQLRRQHALVQGSAVLPEAEGELENYRDKANRLRLANRLSSLFGARGFQRVPAVTPIAIEVAADFESLADRDGAISPHFADSLSMMRDGLRYELGIEFPGARIRLNESDLPPGSYILMLQEISLVMGTVAQDDLLCSETVSRLQILGIEARETKNPANGNTCAWVRKDHEEALRAAGLTLWKPHEYIVLHLASVLRKNASEFAGVQAVANLVRQKAPASFDPIRRAPGGLLRFANVLAALLAEQIPIHEMAALGRRYLETVDLPTHEIAEELRCLEPLRTSLRWNQRDNPVYRLGERFCQLIHQGIRRVDAAAVLALEPEPTQAALTAVRDEVSHLDPTVRNPVILVDDWRARPFVRKLIELEFPHLAAISRREALDPDAMPVIATIELE